MSVRQTLQNAPNGTVFARRTGDITFFLRKINNTSYEVWNSAASNVRSPVTLDQAITFYNTHNLVNATAAARSGPTVSPPPRTPPAPAPPASRLDTALSTLRAGGQVPLSNGSAVVLVNNKLLIFNPRVISSGQLRAGNPRLAEEKIQTQIANGNASVITQADLNRALNPTPSAPPPRAPTPVQAPRQSPPPATAPQRTPDPTPDTSGPSEEFLEAFADLLEEPESTTDPSNPTDTPDPEPITSEDPESPATADDLISPFKARQDWRVRLALSDDPSVNYLYKAPNPGILNPLNATNGVIFPYTPNITVNYVATYNPTELVHSNYKVYQYSSSSIDNITITCDFTAQSTYEANYILAVIHFFRSATKMFYGQDENPRRGTPPPLCYIYGMGSYQFAGQPLAISNFSYNLPNNVDYIKTSVGGDTASATTQPGRMAGTGVARGGVLPPPDFAPIAEPDTVSWVPSKIQITVTCVPMPSRNQVSNEFSFRDYATGSLLNGVGSRRGAFW
jgi:hypothetical protein